MKQIMAAALAIAAFSGTAMADITVNVAKSVGTTEFPVEYGYIADMLKPRAERPEALKETCKPVDGKFTLKTLPDGPAQYRIFTGNRSYVMVYTVPGENVDVNISGTDPLDYTMKGTKLVEDVAGMDVATTKIMKEYQDLMAAGNADEQKVKDIENRYNKVFTDYIAANPDAAAVAWAVSHLEGQNFLDAYNAMTDAAKGSILAGVLEQQKKYVERSIAAEKRKAELNSGSVDAPDFTFNDMAGNPVSLSDFRGKWVIIDFWGSWCPWCIKGFPKLKEAYAKYQPKLEVIGVACNDPKAKWEAAVKKYELPWVNVFNPEDGGGKLLADYAVEGFPTKAIINPEGKVVNITTGEDPAFFEILDNFMK